MAGQSRLTQPRWVRNSDTPRYIVHDRTDDYELREYEETKWARTAMADGVWETQSDKSAAFSKLFQFISGRNSSGEKIPMTVPVRMEHSLRMVDMAFMVPRHYTNNTPQPLSNHIQVITEPRQLVYVRTFGGFANTNGGSGNSWETELFKLQAALERDGQTFDRRNFFTAAYDAPYKTCDRHNEIWLTKV